MLRLISVDLKICLKPSWLQPHNVVERSRFYPCLHRSNLKERKRRYITYLNLADYMIALPFEIIFPPWKKTTRRVNHSVCCLVITATALQLVTTLPNTHPGILLMRINCLRKQL